MALLPEISQICLEFNPFGSTIQSLTMQRNTLHDTYQKLMIFGLRLSFCSLYLYWVTITVLFSLIKKLPCGFAAQTRYVDVLVPALFPAFFPLLCTNLPVNWMNFPLNFMAKLKVKIGRLMLMSALKAFP